MDKLVEIKGLDFSDWVRASSITRVEVAEKKVLSGAVQFRNVENCLEIIRKINSAP